MINKPLSKEELGQLDISDTGQTFVGTIAIFQHHTGVVLFNILKDGQYEVHGASQLNFMNICDKHAERNKSED